jgi:hypothetical protein
VKIDLLLRLTAGAWPPIRARGVAGIEVVVAKLASLNVDSRRGGGGNGTNSWLIFALWWNVLY